MNLEMRRQLSLRDPRLVILSEREAKDRARLAALVSRPASEPLRSDESRSPIMQTVGDPPDGSLCYGITS